MRILIVDDDSDARTLLERFLTAWGHEVLLCTNGVEAWELLQSDSNIPLVISDWMMPGLSGPALCRLVRGTSFPHYIYIILLTGKQDKNDVVEGMEAGADDFISKPFDRGELKVRIKAGERILKLERTLADQNLTLASVNEKLQKVYSFFSMDLKNAARLQRVLLPDPGVQGPDISCDWMFIPSAYVAGDMINYFPLGENHMGFYILDVCGHGPSAAMLSYTLSKTISPQNMSSRLLRYFDEDKNKYVNRLPAEVLHRLNAQFLGEGADIHYFSMLYGVISFQDYSVQLAQGGHPEPYLINKGKVRGLGPGGMPVGITRDMTVDTLDFTLEKGESMVLYSDGVTECMNADEELFTEERLQNTLARADIEAPEQLLDIVQKELREHCGSDEYQDDLTMLVIKHS